VLSGSLHAQSQDQPICIKGPVTKGFGRGSRELGIPTANIDPHTLRQALSEAVTGIYTGYASVGTSGAVYPHVMSIGWNPYYGELCMRYNRSACTFKKLGPAKARS
jgi:FAD synthase